ncbi:MAG: efflux RND transporter periplasmic adaptor subunit [candidate division WWE3 bacterium]|nr:efflux RND transporter periplasmic adaptor subunit [candidate division WWE3 bacterium]
MSISLKARIAKTPLFIKIGVAVFLLGLGYFIYTRVKATKSNVPQYVTGTVTKGTLVVAVTGSGNISSVNSAQINTLVSGTVTKVYVKNGDTVTKGQVLADVALDTDSTLNSSKNWTSYLSAKNSLVNAQINKVSLEQGQVAASNSLDTATQSITTLGQAVSNAETAYTTAQQNWQAVVNDSHDDPNRQKAATALSAAAAAKDAAIASRDNYNQNVAASSLSSDVATQKYGTADDAISLSQASLSTAWLTYQQSLPQITAPTDGILSNFNLLPNTAISTSTSTSGTKNSTVVGFINLPASSLQAKVSLSEIDVVKVIPGQKVTLTMDAFPGKTYTGRVLAIDTSGTTSSNVTSYPTTIILDSGEANMYPNMAVNASIITSIVDNALLIPNGALQTANGATTARILTNGQLNSVAVTVGLSDGTDTVVTTGLNEGDSVVTGIVSATTTSAASSKSSIFSTLGGSRSGAASFGR